MALWALPELCACPGSKLGQRRLLDVAIKVLHEDPKWHFPHTLWNSDECQFHCRLKIDSNGIGIRPNQFTPRRGFTVELREKQFCRHAQL
jgi:hypothetical protein